MKPQGRPGQEQNSLSKRELLELKGCKVLVSGKDSREDIVGKKLTW